MAKMFSGLQVKKYALPALSAFGAAGVGILGLNWLRNNVEPVNSVLQKVDPLTPMLGGVLGGALGVGVTKLAKAPAGWADNIFWAAAATGFMVTAAKMISSNFPAFAGYGDKYYPNVYGSAFVPNYGSSLMPNYGSVYTSDLNGMTRAAMAADTNPQATRMLLGLAGVH